MNLIKFENLISFPSECLNLNSVYRSNILSFKQSIETLLVFFMNFLLLYEIKKSKVTL